MEIPLSSTLTHTEILGGCEQYGIISVWCTAVWLELFGKCTKINCVKEDGFPFIPNVFNVKYIFISNLGFVPFSLYLLFQSKLPAYCWQSCRSVCCFCYCVIIVTKETLYLYWAKNFSKVGNRKKNIEKICDKEAGLLSRPGLFIRDTGVGPSNDCRLWSCFKWDTLL